MTRKGQRQQQSPVRNIPPPGDDFLLRAPAYALRLNQGLDLSIAGCLETDVYPADWADITYFIKHLAKWHCEHCGHGNDYGKRRVLTTHHLNMIKSDCRYINLVALCQKCHLYIQGTFIPNQLFLLDNFIPPWVRRRGIHVSPSLLLHPPRSPFLS